MLLCSAQFVVVLDASIVNVALPTIGGALGLAILATLLLIRTADSRAHVELAAEPTLEDAH